MAVELASKKRVRAGHGASTTRFLGQVDAAITSVPLDVAKITQLKRSLEDKLTSLNTLDEGILTLTPEEAIEEEIVQDDEVREQIYTALSRLELALKAVPVPTVHTESPLEAPVARTPAKLTDTATIPTDPHLCLILRLLGQLLPRLLKVQLKLMSDVQRISYPKSLFLDSMETQ